MKYLYEDLTKQVIGLTFEVYNDLGYGYQEKYYQRAFAELLKDIKIVFRRELCQKIIFRNKEFFCVVLFGK